jgi:hypothetical protein
MPTPTGINELKTTNYEHAKREKRKEHCVK